MTSRSNKKGGAKNVEREVQCETCESWTQVSVTEKTAEKGYVCGFCASEKIQKLEEMLGSLMKEMEELKRGREEDKKEEEEKNGEIEQNQEQKPSWVQVLKKGMGKKMLQQEVREASEQMQRETNVIAKGIEEGEEGKDQETVEEILKAMDMEQTEIVKMERIGTKQEGKKRPIKISLKSKKVVLDVLKNKIKLQNQNKTKLIFIEKDLTRKEREISWKLRKELKEKREKGERCYIIDGEIVSKGPFLPKDQRNIQNRD